MSMEYFPSIVFRRKNIFLFFRSDISISDDEPDDSQYVEIEEQMHFNH